MATDAKSQFTNESWASFCQHGFVFSKSEDQLYVGWGQPKALPEASGFNPAVYTPDFYLETAEPWLEFPHVVAVYRKDLADFLLQHQPLGQQELEWQNPDFGEYTSRFEKVQAEIQSGSIEKAVPIVFARSEGVYFQEQLAHHLLRLLDTGARKQTYGLWSNKIGILGASPEILFSLDTKNAELQSMALAGTRSAEAQADASLLEDKKEMREHSLVVRGLWEKLKNLGAIAVKPTRVWDLGSICHLRTDFKVSLARPELTPEQFVTVTKMLHPTAALGTYPVNKDLDYIKQFEGPMDRGAFGAPFGLWLPTGFAKVLVAIRNIMWDQDSVYLGTGCGLIADSKLENEWTEHRLKRESVQNMLGV